jgi:DNA-binding NarL/FixJ family response regulator
MNTEDGLANRHFLVVDDEEFIRTLVARFLKRAGAAAVIEAADGAAAMAAIASYDLTFDAVISDINMRPVNGIDLLRAIRTGAGGLKRNTPVLLLTVHGEAELVAEAMALDADAFVLKPVERKSLVDRILRVLESTVTIGSVGHYASVYGESNIHATLRAPIGAAPASKPLVISEEALAVTPTRKARRSPAREAEAAEPVAIAHRVALGSVKVNSILAQDICVSNTTTLLLGAPTILTRVMLDRLADLQQIHDTYSHVVVIEPHS